jgi:hypothetical protein
MTVGPPDPPLNLDDPATLTAVQREYEHALSHIEACARSQFRRIRDPGRREDAIANVIAIGWKQWLSAIRHGNNPNDFIGSIADKAIRQVRSGRRLDRQESANDVLSPRAQSGKGFSVLSLSGHLDEDDASYSNALRDNTTPPAEQAAFHEQYGMLLDELGPRKRRVVEDLAAGGETQELATQHDLSAGRISQIRREAEQAWKRIDRGKERER